ncbi:hypothetical protein Vadar_000883 [Vaccinium darrowii]|uniref:Uncharacterized protein n=1 Tax=Vaccinium darrowii TaxID=229202 RepID=A0ACB7XVW7_9ERIC|nr:hypothetical protein Vadar_000883 [Vaccinium darrowii]
MRNLIGIFKDKASLIKAALSIKRAAASVHVAVLRATTHNPSAPPSSRRLSAVLSLGHASPPTAGACIAAIVDRLNATRDAYVALKCLITLHHVVTKGSVVLKDQLSVYPAVGGRNFLNLSRFRDKRDPETWELSSWVRWYAAVLERNLTVSRVLGTFLSSALQRTDDDHRRKTEVSSVLQITDGNSRNGEVSSVLQRIDENWRNRATTTNLTNENLVRDVDCLVDMVEEICNAPDSLEYQRIDLVYELMNFVGEDYRSTQYQILVRLGELGDRIDGLSPSESAELARSLKRLEGCRERLSALFANKKRNDAFWDAVGETRARVVKLEEERERGKWLVRVGRREEEIESTRFGERVGRPSQVLRLPYGGDWLSVDRVHLNIAPAVA